MCTLGLDLRSFLFGLWCIALNCPGEKKRCPVWVKERCSNLADFIFSFSKSGFEELLEEADDEDGVVDEGDGLDPTVVRLGLRRGRAF